MSNDEPLLRCWPRPAIFLFLLSGAAVFGVSPLRAQTQAAAPRDLAAALELLPPTARQSPLLVVDPQHAPVGAEADPTGSEGGQPSPLQATAERYKRDAVAVGRVMALAPQAMTVLNPDPAPANIFLGLDRNERMRVLEASLTPPQWDQLGSPRGLGQSDLTSEQVPLFSSLMPNPLIIKKVAVSENGGYLPLSSGTRALTEMELSETRLRLSLSMSVFPMPRAGVTSLSVMGNADMHHTGETLWTVDGSPDRLNTSAPYGVVLKAQVPNFSKPSQLSFTLPALSVPLAFGPAVPVDSAFHKMLVGDLVRRIGMAAHLELYADARIAGLPVWVSGAAAPAGDLLRALCLCLTSTFRRVGPSFVLTDDIQGIGARRARLTDWAQDAEAQRLQLPMTLRRSASGQWPADSLAFSPTDPLAQSADFNRRLLSRLGGGFLLTDLPAPQRELFRAYVTRALEQDQPVLTDRVSINTSLRLSYVIPGVGEVQDTDAEAGSASDIMARPKPEEPQPEETVRPMPIPSGWKRRVLLVSPKSEQHAREAVAEAADHGLNQVWVEAASGQDTKILAAALAEGKARHIPVLALVRLLRQPTSSPDINILGETGGAYLARRLNAPPPPQEWDRPADAGSTSATLQWLGALAKTPGLAGVVIRDTAAPGYAFLPARPDAATPAMPAAADLGYSAEARLRFLRQNGVDPIDLLTCNGASQGDLPPGALVLPFYPDLGPQSAAAQAWNAFRYKEGEAPLKRSYATVSTAHPGLPMILGERSQTGWYEDWSSPNSGLACIAAQDASFAAQARKRSKTIFLNLPAAAEDTPLYEYSQWLKLSLPRSGISALWDGFVLDMSAVPPGKVTALLGVIAAKKANE